jgi:hypothetical protein
VLRHELAILRQRLPSAALQLMRLEKIISGGQQARTRRRWTWHFSED